MRLTLGSTRRRSDGSLLAGRRPIAYPAGWLLPLALGFACFTAQREASGQPTPQQAVAAESLYREGWELLQEGKYNAACPKLEESQRLEPAMGTLASLAECYEKTNRPASAWLSYVDVADHDKEPTRAKKARAAADSLEPMLPKITLRVADPTSELPGLEIKRDEIDVRRAQWGAAIPVDMGDHPIRVTAFGKQPWATTVRIEHLGQQAEVTVPALKEATGQGTTAPRPPPARSNQRTTALVLGSAGLAGIAMGGLFGVFALNKASEWSTITRDPGRCRRTSSGVIQCREADIPVVQALESDRSTFATASTIGLIAGGVVVLGAATLWLRSPASPSAPAAAIHVTPIVGQSGAGVLLGGPF